TPPLPRQARVELPREETRRRLEDLVGPAQLPDLLLQPGPPPLLLGGHPRAAAAVDLGPLDPLAEGLHPDPQLAGDPADHPDARAGLLARLEDQPDGSFPQLRRVPL